MIRRMNRLSTAKRTMILGMLVEGMSMRSIERLTGASINTVKKLLSDAGEACAAYHHDNVRGIEGNRTIEHQHRMRAAAAAARANRRMRKLIASYVAGAVIVAEAMGGVARRRWDEKARAVGSSNFRSSA